MFDSQFGSYPDSTYSAPGDTGTLGYVGAQKLCEAMMGQDLMGFHPDSVFRSDGTAVRSLAAGGTTTVQLYNPTTIPARLGAYLPLENANAYPLHELYANPGNLDYTGTAAPANSNWHYVLSDVYNRVTNSRTGKKVGMPVLYYKANTSKQSHDLVNPNNPDNIYNWLDNRELLELGKPFDPAGSAHRLLRYTGTPAEAEGVRFYWNIRNDKVSISRPYRADSYILISAGWDGEYGTADDICNFEWAFRDRLE